MSRFNVLKIFKNKRRFRLIVASILHALFLVAVTLWLLQKNYTYGDEKFVIRWSSIIKKMVFKIDDKPPRNDLLFINTSYDNMLIDRLDDDGFSVGNQVITDREKLSRLFEIMKNNNSNHKYVICDIFFKDPSPYDSSLNENIMKLKNIIIPYHISSDSEIQEPLFKINKGFSDYNIIEGSFLKYSLIQLDSLPSLPLKMYMDLYNASFSGKGIICLMNGKPAFNTVIIDFKVRYYDIREDMSPEPYPYVNLGEFMSLPDSVIAKTIKDRIVIIGDLQERDMHQTLIGTMPGSIILLNVFLTLKESENLIKPLFLAILFLTYFLISLDVFSDKNILERKYIRMLSQNRIGKFFVKLFKYISYLIIASVIIYILYNIHLNILIIALYFNFIDSLLIKIRNKQKAKFEAGI
ncbi:MAG: CHASE2 domain-containing protein [Ignavibacteria bacterium]